MNPGSQGVLGDLPIPLALGLLRLACEGRPSDEEAIELIHRALDAGVRVLDTADSYCLNDKDFHYGERLAQQAVDTWTGARGDVRILTKVGMVRPKGRWVPEGGRKHILKSVEGSLEALQTNQLFLLQLHVRDPRVPFEETLETLEELQSQGKVLHLGLCNVGISEIEQAARHFKIEVIQNELSVMARQSAEDGTLEWARRHGVPFLAYRPLGGYAKVEKLTTNRTIGPIATKLGIPATQIALATLRELAPSAIPLVGARRLESLQSSLDALKLRLDDASKVQVASKLSFAPSVKALRDLEPRVPFEQIPKLPPNQGPGDSPEVVMLMGIQGAGKTSLVREYTDRGYERLNRDLQGGSLDDLIDELDRMLDEGAQRVVLDNTYPTQISRAPVIAKSHSFGIPVRCRYLATSIEDARINVCHRMLDRYQRLLGPDEMKELSKQDPNLPPPIAMQRWAEGFEMPSLKEGISAVEVIPFVRRIDPGWNQKAILLDVDGTLRKTKSGELYPRSADDVELLPNRTEVLQTWIDLGYQLFFVSNQSGIASEKLTQEDAEQAFQRTIELLHLPVKEVAYCPHSAFPVGCFCRKPFPGLAVSLMRKHGLDPKQWIMVGDMDSDEAFAKGIGAKYFTADEFFRSKP